MTFVMKVVSLFFNILFGFVIAFPPMRKNFFFFFFLWLQLPSIVILEPKKIKSKSKSFMDFQGPKDLERITSWTLSRRSCLLLPAPLTLFMQLDLSHPHMALGQCICLCLPTMSFPLILIYLSLYYSHSYSQMLFLQRCPAIWSSVC